MNMFIVDCRYPRTTTPVGIPDFTLLVEADSTEEAMQLSGQADCGDNFVAVGACDALSLVDMLRSHVRILAAFGLEMAHKSREAGIDVAEFKALVEVNGIAMPDDEDDEDARTERLREENFDMRCREAKWAFEHFDFEAYGGVAEIVSWDGNQFEEIAETRLGGYANAAHWFIVEFEESTNNVIHVGVFPMDHFTAEQNDIVTRTR